jgi:hypothetical protein
MGISSQKLKLKPINLNDKTIEEFCTEQVNLASKSIRTKGLRGDYDDYLQAFDDILCDKFFRKENSVYQIISNAENKDDFLVKENADGTIDVMMYYNNGGCHWTDILKDINEIK